MKKLLGLLMLFGVISVGCGKKETPVPTLTPVVEENVVEEAPVEGINEVPVRKDTLVATSTDAAAVEEIPVSKNSDDILYVNDMGWGLNTHTNTIENVTGKYKEDFKPQFPLIIELQQAEVSLFENNMTKRADIEGFFYYKHDGKEDYVTYIIQPEGNEYITYGLYFASNDVDDTVSKLKYYKVEATGGVTPRTVEASCADLYHLAAEACLKNDMKLGAEFSKNIIKEYQYFIKNK